MDVRFQEVEAEVGGRSARPEVADGAAMGNGTQSPEPRQLEEFARQREQRLARLAAH